jgi:hypothetical protein
MSTGCRDPNRELADQALAISRSSDGLQKTAVRTVAVALAYFSSVKVAWDSLAELERSDVREATLQLLDQLTARDV